MSSVPKPMSPSDRKLRLASVALRDAKRCGVQHDITRWSDELDRLLDEKLDQAAAR